MPQHSGNVFDRSPLELRRVLHNEELRKDFEYRYADASEEFEQVLSYLSEGRAISEAEERRRARVVAYERLDPLRKPTLRLPEDHEDHVDLGEAAFPDDSALLTAADVAAYQAVVSLIEPFDVKDLKSTSYEAFIAGTVIYWDEKGERQEFDVAKGDALLVPANTIVFVQTQVEFTLPLYIAVRFNLRITHVHRGMLLGTGPLVDPGFRGRLLIPLHNLTNSDYWIDTSKALIWIEFTRTSYDRKREEHLRTAFKKTPYDASRSTAMTFEPRKRLIPPDGYLRRANGQEPIRSSIPDVITKTQRAAERARREVTTISLATIAALAIGTASFLGAVYAAVSLASDTGRIERLEDRLRVLDNRTIGNRTGGEN